MALFPLLVCVTVRNYLRDSFHPWTDALERDPAPISKKADFPAYFSSFILLILLARPFVMTDQPNPQDFKILSLTDFSGSMNTRDSGENMKRIEQVRPFFSLDNEDSWINQMKNQYGKVESLGFSENLFRINRDSWVLT